MEKKQDSNIIHVDFKEVISKKYLSYALSTIMSRSLPDVRDGLKPVHRRLLYAMLKLKLDPANAFKKCSRVVGDVIGKYHPHGDTAVYDTLVRLAQSFALRYPLINGQGNFGSIDGDNAAAMRYTESKMTEICMMLLEDLDKETVDYTPTYDNSDEEPSLLPAAFPNLLANGSEGIAVGMATSVPPHNLGELCDALLFMLGKHIDNKSGEIDIEEILKLVKGPDFPTGGIIVDSEKIIAEGYKTGRGSFRVRAKWEKENLSHGLYQIIVTEIPYQVQKSKLIEHVANLMRDKKIPLVGNIRDESTEEIRIVIEPKSRSSEADAIMQSLFKQTALESRASLNLNVLSSKGTPRVMNLMEVLEEFIEFRKEIVTKRSQYHIKKIEARLEILEALKIAYLNLDEVIRIVREEDEPKSVMMQSFKINDIQAEAILNTRLRALRKLEEIQIEQEYNDLQKKLSKYMKLVQSKSDLLKEIYKEIGQVKEKFGQNTEIGKRRTKFEEAGYALEAIDISAFVEREPITIIVTEFGWIRALKGHKLDLSTVKYKDSDNLKITLEIFTTDYLIIMASNGRAYTCLADNISKGKGQGESIRLMFDMESADIVNIFSTQKSCKILLASSNGKGFIIDSKELIAHTKNGKQIMNLPSESRCIAAKEVQGDMVAVVGTNRKLLVFSINEIPELKKGSGVGLQKYRDAQLSDITTFNKEEGLSWKVGNKTRLEKSILSWQTSRAGIGKIPPTGFPKDNKF